MDGMNHMRTGILPWMHSTYDEPSKSKKGTLKKIEERGEDLAYFAAEVPGIGNSSTGNRGRFECCRKGYDYQSHDSAS